MLMALTKIVILLCAIALSEAAVKITRSSQDGKHPSSMELEVSLPNNQEKAKLTLRKVVSKRDVPVTISANGVTTSVPEHMLADTSSHYEDLENGALISSRFVGEKRQFDGYFSHMGKAYFVKAPNSKGSEHKIRHGPDSLASNFTGNRQTTTTYTVEVYVLLDHTVWNYFRSLSASDFEALTTINYYYGHIMKGVDKVYRNIDNISISVESVGIHIAKTEADAKWSGDYDEGGVILYLMGDYVYKNKITADHVMGFTVKQLHRLDAETGDVTQIAGLASLGGSCKHGAFKTSLVKDSGLNSWNTAAHELGHNLGAYHDGDNEACKASDLYVMTPKTEYYNMTTIERSYQFSSCSIADIKMYVESLSPNCLTTNGPGRLQAGKLWNLDQVCKFIYHETTGFFITNETSQNPASMCAFISCGVNINGTVEPFHIEGMRAPAGTSCGNKKSCNNNGKCEFDSTAPEADEKCFFGDISNNCEQYINYVKNTPFNAILFCPIVKKRCCKSMGKLCDNLIL